jgi:hypothetical protein
LSHCRDSEPVLCREKLNFLSLQKQKPDHKFWAGKFTFLLDVKNYTEVISSIRPSFLNKSNSSFLILNRSLVEGATETQFVLQIAKFDG